MQAANTVKSVDLPGGGCAEIRKMTDRQWTAWSRLARDTFKAEDVPTKEAKGDASDDFVLASGVVSVDGSPDNLKARLDELTDDGLPFLIRSILEYTKPEMFKPDEDAAKNVSGPSVDTSTGTGPSQTNGESRDSARSSASSRRRSKRN